MTSVWTTFKNFLWWNHDRGSWQYDVMVTLILAFIFLGPLKINFNDKPIERAPHPTRVVLIPDTAGGYVYEVDASAVQGQDSIEAALRRVIEPIAGEVEVRKYEPVRNAAGKVTAYKVWVNK